MELAELAAQGETDAGGVKTCRSHLIEKGREGVIVVTVDDCNIEILRINEFCQVQTGKSPADDNHILFCFY